MNELRNIFIKLDANNSKNLSKIENSGILDNASFKKETNVFNINEVLDEVYEKYPVLHVMDDKFGSNSDIWKIGLSTVSKRRVISNMYNYVGNGDPLLESVMYNAHFENQSEVYKIIEKIPTLEMDVNKNVELSQRI